MNLFRRNAGRALLLLTLFLFLPDVANACGCRPKMTAVLDEFETSDLVVIARVTALIKGPNRFPTSDISHSTAVIEKVFKGDIKAGDEIRLGQGDPILDCSWDFFPSSVGDKFLFYLDRPEKPSEPFWVSTCRRSSGVEYAKDDLLYLENIDKVRGRTRVSGVVERDDEDDENLAGHQVRITGRNKSYIATTDKDGVYEIYDLPPGRYTIEPLLQSGWRIDHWLITREETRTEWRRSNKGLPPLTRRAFTLRARKHFGADIILTLANRIAGRVTTATGEPLNQVCVSLVSPDETDSSACQDFTDTDGTFKMESIEAGSYQLVINHKNIRSTHHRFPKQYYPGVVNAADAKVFTLKSGESIEGLNFVVSTLYETVKVEGTVRYSNGRPAAYTRVLFDSPKTAEVDGDIETTTDKRGRFSLKVLKGLQGELHAAYSHQEPKFVNCPRPNTERFWETPHLPVEANESKTFELRFQSSPCR